MKFRLGYLLLSVLMLVSCTDKEEKHDIYGDWKLISLSGTKSNDVWDDLDVYLSFRKDNTFELFQQLGDLTGYDRFTGTFRLKGNVLTGTYSDGSPLRTGYTVSFEDGANIMVMDGDNGETCRYRRSSLP